MRVWALLLGLLAANLGPAVRAVRLLQRARPPPPCVFGCGAPTGNTDCGALGASCCEKELGDYMYASVCNDDSLFCLIFPSANTSDAGPSPTLCLPKPDGCGAAGSYCCPQAGPDLANPRCTADSTICLAPNETSIYGDLTYETYTQLRAAPETPLPNATAFSVFGTCQFFAPETCGQEGGLCGTPLPEPAPQCPEDTHKCPSWLYCQPQQGQFERFGRCAEIPLGCGDLGKSCCPYGNYSAGDFQVPFCWAPNVYCQANARNISDTICKPLPVSPRDCGAPGRQCCPYAYGLVTDKDLPPPCQPGAYCVGADVVNMTTAGICVLNPPECGEVGKPCCGLDGRSGTIYACNEGNYCPDPNDVDIPGQGNGTFSRRRQRRLAQMGPGPARLCKECNALVPQKYQTVCGIGIGAGSPGPVPPPPPLRPPYPPILYPPIAWPGTPGAPPQLPMAPGAAPGPSPGMPPIGGMPAPEPGPAESPLPASPAPAPPPSPAPAPPPSFSITEEPPAPAPSSPELLAPAPEPQPPALPPVPVPAPGELLPPLSAPAPAPGELLPPLPAPAPAPSELLPPLSAPAPVPAPSELLPPLPAPAPAPQPQPGQPPASAPTGEPAPGPAPVLLPADVQAPPPPSWEWGRPSGWAWGPGMAPGPAPMPAPEPSEEPGWEESPGGGWDGWESPSPSPGLGDIISPSPYESPSPSPYISPSPEGDNPSPSPPPPKKKRRRPPPPPKRKPRSPSPDESPSPSPDESPSPPADESPSPSPEESPSPSPEESPSPDYSPSPSPDVSPSPSP